MDIEQIINKAEVEGESKLTAEERTALVNHIGELKKDLEARTDKTETLIHNMREDALNKKLGVTPAPADKRIVYTKADLVAGRFDPAKIQSGEAIVEADPAPKKGDWHNTNGYWIQQQ